MKKTRVGVHALAERAKVSIGTVDRALHGRPGIKEKTRERILRIANELGYQPNLAARALSTSQKKFRIAVCLPREIHFFYDELWEGIRDEARRYDDYGVEFIFRPVPKLGDETAEVERIIRTGVHGVVLTPGSPDNIIPILNAAEDKGIRVLCVSTDAPNSQRSGIVCVDPYLNGLLAGELMAKFLPSGSKVAIVTGMLRTVDHAKKSDGFSASFLQACPQGQVVEVIEAFENQAQSFKKSADLLGRNSDLTGIYVNTVNCLPVCRSLEMRRRAGDVRLITTDLFEEMVPYFENGTIWASIYQRPYQQGRTAISTLVEHLIHGRPLQSTYLDPTVVLRSTLRLYREVSRPINEVSEPTKLLSAGKRS